MSNETTEFESDEAWLRHHAEPTEEQVEEFAERVAIMHIDGGVELERARVLSMKRVMG